jgi:hypothetical protein
MSWDGVDRRQDGIEVRERLARIEEKVGAIEKTINGNINDIKTHIEHGNRWRLAIAGIAASLLLSIMSGVFAYGKLCGLVEDNTQEIARLRQ